MATMEEIEGMVKIHADRIKILTDRVRRIKEETEAVKRKYLPGIKSAVGNAAESRDALANIINESRDLFLKKKTVTVHGIRFGIKKEKGKLDWKSEAGVIKKIKTLFVDTWETYIKTKEKPIKKALEKLPAADLKKLGIRVDEDTDEVYIKGTDSEIEKFVNALIESADGEMKEAS